MIKRVAGCITGLAGLLLVLSILLSLSTIAVKVFLCSIVVLMFGAVLAVIVYWEEIDW